MLICTLQMGNGLGLHAYLIKINYNYIYKYEIWRYELCLFHHRTKRALLIIRSCMSVKISAERMGTNDNEIGKAVKVKALSRRVTAVSPVVNGFLCGFGGTLKAPKQKEVIPNDIR